MKTINRPGVQFEYKGAAPAAQPNGRSGVAVIPVPLSWGDSGKLIKLNADEFVRGTRIADIGLQLGDVSEAALRIQESLKYCYEVLLWNTNGGGEIASVVPADGFTLKARFAGKAGDDIAVAVIPREDSAYTVRTLYRKVVRDTQIISDWAGFTANSWLVPEFAEGTETAVINAENTAMPLTGGTDAEGEADSEDLFALLRLARWSTLAVPDSGLVTTEKIKGFIAECRESTNKSAQAVLINAQTPDYEGSINIKPQGFMLDDVQCDASVLCCAVAAMSAGAEIPASNTNRVLIGATDISVFLTDAEIENALAQGFIVLERRVDGAITVVQDINSLITISEEKPYQFRKNRTLRIIDDISTQVLWLFETGYKGYVGNDETQRGVLFADIAGILQNAQDLGAIRDLNPEEDITILQGESIEDVILQYAITPVDAMEKLYVTVNLR